MNIIKSNQVRTRRIKVVTKINPRGLVTHDHYSTREGEKFPFREDDSIIYYTEASATREYHERILRTRYSEDGKAGSMISKVTIDRIVY